MMSITWKTYNSINDFDVSIWDDKIAAKNPFSSSSFMKVVEKIHPHDFFYYFIGEDMNSKIVAIGFMNVTSLDLLQKYAEKDILKKIRNFLPGFLKLKIGMTATWETYGHHFWYDTNIFNYESFVKEFIGQINKNCKKHVVQVFRDYLDDSKDFELHLNENNKQQFVSTESVSFSKIFIEKGTTEESFFYNSIKKKHRNYLKKIFKDKEDKKLTVDFINDYLPLLDEVLYPLYANVNKNAKEYQTALLPKTFFHSIKSTWGDNNLVLVVKDKDGTILAFVMLVKDNDVLNPFLIGMDYSKREHNLWYHSTWGAIVYAINNHVRMIDLGATNTGMKTKLGAQVFKNYISLRFTNKTVNFFLKKFLKHLS